MAKMPFEKKDKGMDKKVGIKESGKKDMKMDPKEMMKMMKSNKKK